MSCLFPVQIINPSHNSSKKIIEVSCNHCLNCLIRKQSQLEFLARKELIDLYQKGLGASFVTLTYREDKLPLNRFGFPTLRKQDLQKFHKRVRRTMDYYKINIPYKHISCGELGDDFGRPHYHIIFLGLSDSIVAKLTKHAWKDGLIDIGPLAQGGLQYVINYISKQKADKDVKKLRDENEVVNPFLTHSIGLGKNWIKNNVENIYNSKFTFSNNGKISLFPKYVIDYVCKNLNITKSEKNEILYNFYKKDFNYIKSGLSYQDYNAEISYIKYKQKVAALRSKNIPVNDMTTSTSYIRPKHSKYYKDVTSFDLKQLVQQCINLAYAS